MKDVPELHGHGAAAPVAAVGLPGQRRGMGGRLQDGRELPHRREGGGPATMQRFRTRGTAAAAYRDAKPDAPGRSETDARSQPDRDRNASADRQDRPRPSISGSTRQSLAEPERVLGRAGQADRLDQALHQGDERLVRRRRVDQLVRGRHAQRLLQLHRPAPGASTPTRPRSCGKATTRRKTARSPIANCTSRCAGSPMC